MDSTHEAQMRAPWSMKPAQRRISMGAAGNTKRVGERSFPADQMPDPRRKSISPAGRGRRLQDQLPATSISADRDLPPPCRRPNTATTLLISPPQKQEVHARRNGCGDECGISAAANANGNEAVGEMSRCRIWLPRRVTPRMNAAQCRLNACDMYLSGIYQYCG